MAKNQKRYQRRLDVGSIVSLFLLAVVVAVVACGFVGIYLSFFIDVSSGAAAVLVEAAVFALIMAYNNLRPRRVPGVLHEAHQVNAGQPSPGESD